VSWRNCIRLLAKGVLKMAPVITHTLNLSAWEKGFQLTRTREAVKVILTVE
jgi:threonine dehydrogenase-like Zn-dependent dehydrogenase